MPGFRLAPGADHSTVAAHLDAIERDIAESPLAERVLLVAAEMLSNAAEHGGGPIQVEWGPADAGIVLTIQGEGPDAGQISRAVLPDATATRGRGLFLIHALTTSVHDIEGGLRLAFR